MWPSSHRALFTAITTKVQHLYFVCRQVLCVSHPRRADDLIGDVRIEGRVTIRLVNHPDTEIQIKDIRSYCIGAQGLPGLLHTPLYCCDA